MKRNLDDMVVIITGASAGIGKALAIQLSAKDCRLVLSARRIDRLNELNNSLGGKHLVIAADVAIREQCEALINSANQTFGRIDTLICNAGYGITSTVAKTTAADMHAIFQTNVFGTTDCVRAAVPIMQTQNFKDGYRGQVVIISSAAARRGLPYFGAYSATKAAQLSIAEAMRVELSPLKIAVTSVHPVGTNTEFFDVAAKSSGIQVPPPKAGEVRQSSELVAAKIIKAIVKPKPEVWPLMPARFALSFATIAPRFGDWIMSKYRGDLEAQDKA